MSISINDLWWHGHEAAWQQRLDVYWSLVRPELSELEREMSGLDAGAVRRMNADEWYRFLEEKYFRWKYTAPNRYATTTGQLRKYVETGTLDALQRIQHEIFAVDTRDIARALTVATQIRGLGPAGASGLLSLLFPDDFGTVDQFAVKALRLVDGLPQAARLLRMAPESLTIADGVVLVGIMRAKAKDLNERFKTNSWSSRQIDIVLWTCGR